MRVAAILAALTCAAIVSAQGPPEGIAPDAKAPEGCDGSPKNNFTIGYTLLSKMKRETAVDAKNAALECNLKDGILRDPQNRIGSVVANRQFQFDGPPQAGAIYTGGFSVCKNNSLAIGATTRWWKCGSGDFYNLYDEWIGAQCDEIRIVVTYKGDTSSEGSSSSSVSASATSTQSSSATSSASSSASSSSGSSSSGSATSTPTSSSRSSSSASSSGAPQTTQTRAPTENNASNPPAPSAGDAAPTRVPRRETFGVVVGIVGAALLL